MVMWSVIFFVGGFLIGIVSLVALESLGVYVLIKRLKHKNIQQHSNSSNSSSPTELNPQQSLDYAYNKKGFVWILDLDKGRKSCLSEKLPKDQQKRKKDVFEVTPVRMYGKIRDGSLILTNSNGCHTAILLKGCIIEAVSATSLSSRKWAKRFPIKVESKTSVIYNASTTVYIYLDTSWEKESWCKALRLASCVDKTKLKWFAKLNQEFRLYLHSLNTEYPSFMKPSVGIHAEPIDRFTGLDGSASKVRSLWRKLARKPLKAGVDNKGISLFGREERKISDRSRSFPDPVSSSGLLKTASTVKAPITAEEENMASVFSRSASQSHTSVVSDVDSDDKFNFDEGTLCWNLLISRLFFDAKHNDVLKTSVQTRIQRTLSNMRTPTYIGEVLCTDLDIGNLPPYIHGIRVLPTDMNEVWAWEVDIEYCGGVVLDIETRLEVCDQDLQKGIVEANSESSSVEDVSSDLLEGFEHFGSQLNLSDGTVDPLEQKDEGDSKLDGLRNSTSCVSTLTSASRWKSILNSIAKQVSQVPLSLSIRIASLRGTVRFHIKPPPSDQLWIGFTSMPDIEFDLESTIGEHKFTSAHVALFLINRFKTAIRESMVLPNSESVCIPWMLAEKNDWVPRNVAPFMWLNQEATSNNQTTARENFSSLSDDVKTKTEARRDTPESKHQKTSNIQSIQKPSFDSGDAVAGCSNSSKPSTLSSKSLQELKTPLLADGEALEMCQQSKSECQSPTGSLTHAEKQNHVAEEDDSRPKRMGRRARMLDLGKKMGEKLEEKRRHIEEKGRNIVEKMRGP